MPKCPTNYEHYYFGNGLIDSPTLMYGHQSIDKYLHEIRYGYNYGFKPEGASLVGREFERINKEAERERREMADQYEAAVNREIALSLKAQDEALFSTRSDDLWETKDRRGNPIFGFKGDLSHAHTDDVNDPSWISIRTEDSIFKKRYNKRDLYGGYYNE